MRSKSTFFSAIDRYQAIQKLKNEFHKPDTNILTSASNFAANISVRENSNKFRQCILCSDGSGSSEHAISKCTRFPNAQAKISKLKQLNSCIKCANNNHKSDDCKFRFYKNCYFCNNLHFSFLCPYQNKSPAYQSEQKTTGVSTGTISIEATTLNFESNFPTVLPNFTVPLQNGTTIRGIKDSGAQCAIILSSVAEQNNLKIVKIIDININGFNASKPYTTQVVEVPIILDTIHHTIQAVCVPDINIKLKLQGLNDLVSKFISCNIQLADKYLLEVNHDECVDNVHLILGADYGYLLNENNRLFSENAACNCYETPLGVVISGNIDEISKNISFLSPPHIENTVPPKCEAVSLLIDAACVTVAPPDLASALSEHNVGPAPISSDVGEKVNVPTMPSFQF